MKFDFERAVEITVRWISRLEYLTMMGDSCERVVLAPSGLNVAVGDRIWFSLVADRNWFIAIEKSPDA